MFIEKERGIRLKEVTVDQIIDRISGQAPNYSLACLGRLAAQGQGDGMRVVLGRDVKCGNF